MANNSSNNRSAFLAARTRFNEASNLEPGASPPSPSGGGVDALGLKKCLGDACGCFKKATNLKSGEVLSSDAATVVGGITNVKWAEVEVDDVVVGFEFPLGERVARNGDWLGSLDLRLFRLLNYVSKPGGRWDVELEVSVRVEIAVAPDGRGEKWDKGVHVELNGVNGFVLVAKEGEFGMLKMNHGGNH